MKCALSRLAGPFTGCLAALAICALLTGCGGKDNTKKRLAAGSPAALLSDAQRQVRLGAYSVAIDLYNSLEIRYPFTEQNRGGQLGLMYAYKKDRQPEAALEAGRQVYPREPTPPESGLRLLHARPGVLSRHAWAN